MRSAVLGLLLAVGSLRAVHPDAVVVRSVASLDQQAKGAGIIHRAAVTQRLDLVIAATSPVAVAGPARRNAWWSLHTVLGLFLQERSRPDRVWTLTSTRNRDRDCLIRVFRVTAREAVLGCGSEKGPPEQTRHFVYDARAMTLVRQFAYAPFAMRQVIRRPRGGPVFIAFNGDRTLALLPAANGSFTVLPEREAALAFAPLRFSESTTSGQVDRYLQPPARSARFGPGDQFRVGEGREDPHYSFGRRTVVTERARGTTREHRLPRTTVARYVTMRPQEPNVRRGWRPEPGSVQDEIGPWQVADELLWFGKTFYDAEGTSGVGGFGFFDPATRRYTVFSPHEVADWSVSALLVEPDSAWLGLTERGEYGEGGGGLLHWDRARRVVTRHVTRRELPGIVRAVVREGNRLYAATDESIAVLADGALTRYRVEMRPEGGFAVVRQ